MKTNENRLFQYVLKRFFKIKNSKVFCIVFLFSFILLILSPYLNGIYIDFLIINNSQAAILYFSVVLVIVGLLAVLLSYISNLSSIKLSNLTAFTILNELIHILFTSRLESVEGYDRSYLTQRLIADTNTLTTYVISNFMLMYLNGFKIFVGVLLFAYIDMKLVILVLLLIPIYALLLKKMKQPLTKANLISKEHESLFFKSVSDSLANILDAKINLISHFYHRKLKLQYESYLDKYVFLHRLSYFFSSIDGIISILFQSIMFLYAGFSILRGDMTVGQFTMISSYFAMILQSVRYYMELGKMHQSAQSSYSRLQEFISLDEDISGTVNLQTVTSISWKNLSFRRGSKKIFDDFSADINENGLYVLTGENGCGKSTFLKIILGLYKSYTGDVLFSDIYQRDLNEEYLRKEVISFVPQNLPVNVESVSDFISIRNDVNTINLYDYIQNTVNLDVPFSKDVMNIIDKNMSQLSGGELRKLYIWDALKKNKKLYVLDEPTISLDIKAKRVLREHIQVKKISTYFYL